MIKREDYHLLMTVLLETAASARGLDDFDMRLHQLIITSYEIHVPGRGRVNVIDMTPFVMDAMGQHWHHLNSIGIERIEIVQFYLKDELMLEAGRMLGKGREDVAIQAMNDLPEVALRGFAKGMVIGMRQHDVHILKRLTGQEDESVSEMKDSLDLASLIREFMEEEVDETVAKFSAQLDSVFGVAAAVSPDWSAPRGEVKHDDLPPPG